MPAAKDVRPEKWSDVLDLYDDDTYSAIWGIYDGGNYRRLGVRWNGNEGYVGYPNQGKNPVWYDEPDFLTCTILSKLLTELYKEPSLGNKDNILIALKECEVQELKIEEKQNDRNR